MLPRVILILTTVIFLCPALTVAQQSKATRADEKSGDTALKEKAYDLLESLATQISTLQSAENRARLGSNIAASLWPHDEKRARALFSAVGEDIKLGLERREDVGDQDDKSTLMVFLHLRENTVDRIAKLDPELAYDFLNETAPTFENAPRGLEEKDRALTVRLAKQIANANPDLALKLGRKALEQGFSDDLLSLLRQLHRKHREQGVALYKETVQKLRNHKLKWDDWQIINFIQTLAQLTPPLADELAFRELINFLIATAQKNKCEQQDSGAEENYFCNRIGMLLSQIEKVDPVRAAKLKHLAPQGEGANGPNIYSEVEELLQAREYDELFALAARYPEMKYSIYWRAFQSAQASGDDERALKIANDYSDNPEAQQRMLAQLKAVEDKTALTDAELEQIQKEAEKSPNLQERFSFLVVTAVRIGARDRAAALKMLDQSLELIGGIGRASERTQAQLYIAMFYCMEKSDRGFAIMETLMPKLNELIDAGAKLDGFDTKYMRDGEWNMTAEGTLGRILTELSEQAGYFAWCDFDRAVTMAAQFERAEIRMMAQVKLAQAILAGPPERYRIGFYVR